MGKTRVHLLAKELGIETKDLIAQLDKLGMRGRKAQSAMEDEEVARVRAALAAQEKPQVHVGEEKVIARVVKTEEEGQGSIEARETVVERRVRTNVIRRRTSRVEVAPVDVVEEAPAASLVEPEVTPEPVVSAEPVAVEEAPLEAHVETPAPIEEPLAMEPDVEVAVPEAIPETIVAKEEPAAPALEPAPIAPTPPPPEPPKQGGPGTPAAPGPPVPRPEGF